MNDRSKSITELPKKKKVTSQGKGKFSRYPKNKKSKKYKKKYRGQGK